jgi:hypothetical protein
MKNPLQELLDEYDDDDFADAIREVFPTSEQWLVEDVPSEFKEHVVRKVTHTPTKVVGHIMFVRGKFRYDFAVEEARSLKRELLPRIRAAEK